MSTRDGFSFAVDAREYAHHTRQEGNRGVSWEEMGRLAGRIPEREAALEAERLHWRAAALTLRTLCDELIDRYSDALAGEDGRDARVGGYRQRLLDAFGDLDPDDE